MSRITEQTEIAASAITSVLDGLPRVGAVPAAEWAETANEIEHLGRLIDAARIAVAAAAASAGRSLPAVAEPLGARSGADALAGCAGISEVEARRRIRLAEALTPDLSITGAVMSERYPDLAAAMRDGRIGVEAAGVIVRELDAVRIRADLDDLAAAEDGLVTFAAARDGGVPARTEFVADAA